MHFVSQLNQINGAGLVIKELEMIRTTLWCTSQIGIYLVTNYSHGCAVSIYFQGAEAVFSSPCMEGILPICFSALGSHEKLPKHNLGSRICWCSHSSISGIVPHDNSISICEPPLIKHSAGPLLGSYQRQVHQFNWLAIQPP